MTTQQREALRRLIERNTAEDTKSKEAARAVLIEEGIYSATGKLTKEYGGTGKAKTKVKA